MTKISTLLLTAALSLGIASFDAEAAKRFGGGGNLGKQSSSPAMKEAPKAVPAQSPAAAPAKGAPATPAAQPSFMQRWGGMIAGLGIGALLGSMFSGSLGGTMGLLLMLLVLGAIGFMVFRMIAARGKPVADKPMAFAGASPESAGSRPRVEIGSNLAGGSAEAVAAPVSSTIPADFPVEAFLRHAKMSFIRLQAANDSRDLDDIRDYTTPEMYAEISMQIGERPAGDQKTEVVNVHPTLVEVTNENGYETASVRFAGLIRESPDANPESFDEVWHVRKKVGDKNATWLIAGIQQLPQ
jgi:predicted lipid-binding transport protein (Tim44 family)